MKITILAALCVVLFSANAEARQHHKATGLHPECNITMPCVASYASTPDQARVARGRYIARQMGIGTAIEKPIRKARRHVAKADYKHIVRERPIRKSEPVRTVSTAIVSHPEGCPRRLFCGCGAAVRIFGKPVRDLWLAANWFKYPRAAPAPGMVAVRSHHVFVLEAHLSGDTWIAYDANSGGHKTRIHARSLAGYVVVNPHGGSG